MEATNVLMEEHRVIERVLDALETAVNSLENGQPAAPEFFLAAVEFMRGYADGCHHEKEEGILFRFMEERGIPKQGCPLGVMLAEHALGRQYTQALRSAAQDMQAGAAGAHLRVIQSGRSYAALLRQHIFKEDNILFPMANQVIPGDQHILMRDRFTSAVLTEEREGAHEKYLALADTLERKVMVK